jgi:hypothetical protein
VPGAVGREGPRSARLLLAPGLIVSAALVAAVGGGWGYGIAAVQLALGATLLVRPQWRGPIAGAMISLVPAPLAAIRHWTAGLPGSCKCARLPHPPPALVSVTGVAVAFDLVLLGYALWLTAARGHLEMIPLGRTEEETT